MRPVAAVAWMVAVGCLAAGHARAGQPEVGHKAPFFFMSTYNPEASGTKRVFLDRLVGPEAEKSRKVLLLSFFNIDCKPCRKELPFLQKLYDRYADQGLGVLAVNCDHRKEKIEEVKSYVKKERFSFPVLKDRFQALQRRYGVGSFPTMFFIDDQATITKVRVGYNEEKMPFPLAELQRILGVPRETIDAGKEKP